MTIGQFLNDNTFGIFVTLVIVALILRARS